MSMNRHLWLPRAFVVCLGVWLVTLEADADLGIHDPCPVPTPAAPDGAGWAEANNPGMEEGFSAGVANDWIGWKDSTLIGTIHFAGTDRAFQGNASQKLVLPQPPANTAHQEAGIYQQIYVVPNASYTVSARLYLEFPIQAYNGEDLLAFVGADPFGQASGDGFATEWDEVSNTGQWVTASVTVQSVMPVLTIAIKGTRKWPQHGNGATVWIDTVTVSGPVPTDPPPVAEEDPVDPESLIPQTTGPNLVANPSFEDTFSNGVSAQWTKWSTQGSGTWKQSQRMGLMGPGRYDCGDMQEVSYMNPKSVLLFGGNPEDNPNNLGLMGDAMTFAADPKFQDTIFLGRPFIDPNLGMYWSTETPEYWGRRFAEQCKHFESLVPRIDCWQGLNEPDTAGNWQQTLRFEKAFMDRCHELGLKACSLNLATGNPGNIWRMIDENFSPSARDILENTDYLGHHIYGGPTDQVMTLAQTLDDPCSFSMRPRRFKDMYDRRGWRFPPVLATEGSTFGGWIGTFSPQFIADDIILTGEYLKADRFWAGYHNFAVNIQCGPAWRPWDLQGQRVNDGRLMTEYIGEWNANNPADAMDGLSSQMFGAGHVHPVTTTQLVPDGDFNGGVNQLVTGLEDGASYLLICWMKYEFRGMQPDDLAFYLGTDSTGQTADGNAASIDWGTDRIAEQAPTHEIYTHVWRTFTATTPQASIWLRAHHPVTNPSVMIYADQVEVRKLTGPPPAVVVSPDFDHDGDVDVDDFAALQTCFSGDGFPQTTPACIDKRLDGDDDVDAADLARLMNCMNGPNVEPDPTCDD